MESRIMYVEYKGEGLEGPGRIARVTFSKSRSSVYFRGKAAADSRRSGVQSELLRRRDGRALLGVRPKRNGQDRLYGGLVDVDEDVREEYWTEIRCQPELRQLKEYRS